MAGAVKGKGWLFGASAALQAENQQKETHDKPEDVDVYFPKGWAENTATRATRATAEPSRVERQPRVMPDAKTIVMASTISTALATNMAKRKRTVLSIGVLFPSKLGLDYIALSILPKANRTKVFGCLPFYCEINCGANYGNGYEHDKNNRVEHKILLCTGTSRLP